MKTAAIICEYNPFHSGHAYHIEKTRTDHGATHVVGIMSGNFTQRGDVAVFDKWKRAESALNNGVDLIIELPAAYALSGAENFAMGAVTLMNKLNCVDILSFGSESGDIELLGETAGAVHYALEHEDFLGKMRRGLSYPAALQETIEKYYDDIIIETLTEPNNTLGIEYLKAINETGSPVKPVTVKRIGARHDGDSPNKECGNASASYLRKIIAGNGDISKFVPKNESIYVLNETAFIEKLETAILSKIRSMPPSEIAKAPGVLQGLENRIYKAARAAKSYNELLFLIKSKRYTLSRLRRIVLCLLLGITKTDAKVPPQYIRVLGMNAKGKELLGKAELPVGTSLVSLMKTGENARRQGLLEEKCGNIYALALGKILPCGIDYTHKPIIL